MQGLAEAQSSDQMWGTETPNIREERVLELCGVTKQYGKVPALTGLTLGLERGQVYGLLGRNGAGKSTTLRIVMGITRPDSGIVKLFGETAAISNVKLRQRLGYVAQEQHFYEWMKPAALGRFAFYPTWNAERYRQLLGRFDVPERKLRTFSGGMKVKLALALALAHDPELLVLDEPTTGLDAVARREFLEIVREQAEGGRHSTLFSSHMIDDVELIAHLVGIIEGGQMLYEGRLASLRERVRVLRLPPAQAPATDPALGAELPTELYQTGLPIRILQDRVLGGERQVTCWADEPQVFAALRQRLQKPLDELPLEEIFIALVRAGRLPLRAPDAPAPGSP